MRVFVILLVSCVALVSQPVFNNPAFNYRSQFCKQSLAFFDRLATQPTWGRKQAYDRLIRVLVDSGAWDKLDALYVFAAADSTTAKVNLISNSYTATEVGSPSFSANGGYTGDNTTATYIDSNFNAQTASSPHFTQNSASIFAWKNTDTANSGGGMAGNGNTFIDPDPGDKRFYISINGGYDTGANLATNNTLFGASRYDSTHFIAYTAGIPVKNSTITSSAPANSTVAFLRDKNGNGSNTQVAAGGMGGNLTKADFRNLFSGLSNYIASVSGVAIPVRLGISSDVVSDGANNLTPGFARLADGRLFCVFGIGDGTGNGAKLSYRTSSDEGRSWSATSDIVSPASGYGYYDSSAKVLSNGNVIISTMYQTNTGTSCAAKIIRGTVAGDLSISWGSPINISTTLSDPATTSVVVPLADGRLMLGIYYWASGPTGTSVTFSSDEGNTWGSEVSIVTNSGGEIFNESNYVQLSNGDIVGMIRNEGTTPGYYRTISTNNGVSFSAPSRVIITDGFTEPGRPSIALLPNDSLFMVSRFGGANTYQTGYTFSSNGGLTWQQKEMYYAIERYTYGQHVYSQGFWDIKTGSLLYAIAQGNFVSAEIDFQQFWYW